MKGISELTSKQKAAVEAQARAIAAERVRDELADSAENFSEWLENPGDGETYITKVTFKPNWGSEGDIFIILNATVGGVDRVAFHGGATFADALISAVKRLRNGSMKWRDDVPYESR